MKKTNAGHMLIELVTASLWIGRGKTISPTSNVRENSIKTSVNSQSANWKYGK